MFCGNRKFVVYPNGDENGISTKHISVLLRVEDTDALPKGWEIFTDIKFFLFDQVRDKYSVFQGILIGCFCRIILDFRVIHCH